MAVLTPATSSVQSICGLGKTALCIPFQYFDWDSATPQLNPIELISVITICDGVKPP